MVIKQDVSLTNYNTFGISAKARYFCEINSLEDLAKALSLDDHPKKFILSGGSNMLITGDIEALVLRLNLKGKTIISENESHVTIKVMAGENWHEFVLWAIDRNYGGIENMSLIPGNVGTAPIQNIGAYGVELKDTFEYCEAMEITTQDIHVFSNKNCHFRYRDSYFKNTGKGKFVITSVTLKLTKNRHTLHTSYGSIEKELEIQNIKTPTIKDVSNAVIAIRKSKLPDPKELGNSGSFFKNPIISQLQFDTFIQNNPNAPYYKVSEDNYKIPAGWLIEQCGFKGKRFGDAGVHENQALVLVNYKNATGNEILELATNIINSVAYKFDLKITPEVNIIK